MRGLRATAGLCCAKREGVAAPCELDAGAVDELGGPRGPLGAALVADEAGGGRARTGTPELSLPTALELEAAAEGAWGDGFAKKSRP